MLRMCSRVLMQPRAGKEGTVTITRDGEVIAFYFESEVVCPACVSEEERESVGPEETLAVEELDGAVEELWCDRCDACLIARDEEACCS